MNDLISREAAIDAVKFDITYAKAFNKETGEVTELFKETNATLEKVAERIRMLPVSEQWIPVSERLPDEDGQYYVTVAFLGDENQVSLYTEVTSFSAKEKEFCDAGVNNYGWDYVTAWMPLQWPEPYEEETNE